MSDAALNRNAQRGKRDLIRTMRNINSYLDAYIMLSIRLGAELVKVSPDAEIFSDGTIIEGFMAKILKAAGMTAEEYIGIREEIEWKKKPWYKRIFRRRKNEKDNRRETV